MTRAPSSISSLVIAGFIAVAFGAAPIGLDDNFAPGVKSAFARGAGSSGGGNSGGGNSGGGNSGGGNRGGGHGGSSASSNSNSGSGQEIVKGSSNSQGVGAASAHNGQGSIASALGNLNAAHASPTALEHAADNSIVGLLAAYADAVEGDPDADPAVPGLTPEEQRAALGGISNKSDEDGLVDTEVVAEVNSLLGID